MKRPFLLCVSVLVTIYGGSAIAHSPANKIPKKSQTGAVVPASGGEIIRKTQRGTETIKVTPEMSSILGMATTHMRAAGMKITPHIHDHDDEAFFVHRGGGLFILGDRKVAIREGDIVFIPRGTVHGFENTSDDTFLVWAISSSKYLHLHRMFFSSGANPSAAEVKQLYKKYGFREATEPP